MVQPVVQRATPRATHRVPFEQRVAYEPTGALAAMIIEVTPTAATCTQVVPPIKAPEIVKDVGDVIVKVAAAAVPTIMSKTLPGQDAGVGRVIIAAPVTVTKILDGEFAVKVVVPVVRMGSNDVTDSTLCQVAPSVLTNVARLL